METSKQWLEWAMELQSLAQAGLYYGKDRFDLERYHRIREIAAQMVTAGSGLPEEKVKDLFCGDVGYQTPKLDTRAAIFQDGKILLVQENNGTWSLPGGWVDQNLSVGESAVKEVLEEAGLEAKADYIIAVQDRKKHNQPVYAYNICKVFVHCTALSGGFRENSETVASGYFSPDALPRLADEKNTAEQIALCFRAHEAENWVTQFD